MDPRNVFPSQYLLSNGDPPAQEPGSTHAEPAHLLPWLAVGDSTLAVDGLNFASSTGDSYVFAANCGSPFAGSCSNSAVDDALFSTHGSNFSAKDHVPVYPDIWSGQPPPDQYYKTQQGENHAPLDVMTVTLPTFPGNVDFAIPADSTGGMIARNRVRSVGQGHYGGQTLYDGQDLDGGDSDMADWALTDTKPATIAVEPSPGTLPVPTPPLAAARHVKTGDVLPSGRLLMARSLNRKTAAKRRRQSAKNKPAKVYECEAPGCDDSFALAKDRKRHWNSIHCDKQPVVEIGVPVGSYGCVCGYFTPRKDDLDRHHRGKTHSFRPPRLPFYVCHCGRDDGCFPNDRFEDFQKHIDKCGRGQPGRPRSTAQSPCGDGTS